MVKVNIRIESASVNDPYWRVHAKGIDQPLDTSGRWQETQPEKYIGTTTGRTFSHEQTVDLPAGNHYVEYAVSSDAGYYWHAKIYINGELKGEGDTDRRKHVRATFTVEAPPIPVPPIPWTQIFMIALPMILGLGLTATSGMT